MMDFALVIILVIVSFISGIGCTTVGPGGIFVTVALYSLTTIPSATVAGTAHLTFIGVGIIGTIGYIRSGELMDEKGRLIAILLCSSSILGAFMGVYLNSIISRTTFGLFLGAITSLTGAIILFRQTFQIEGAISINIEYRIGKFQIFVLGFVLGAISGMVGVGGPVLSVPALVVFGTPILLALGVAQLQAVFISGFSTIGYLSQGAIDAPLAVIVGLPLISGAYLGWIIAHRVNQMFLKSLLGAILLPVGGLLILTI